MPEPAGGARRRLGAAMSRLVQPFAAAAAQETGNALRPELDSLQQSLARVEARCAELEQAFVRQVHQLQALRQLVADQGDVVTDTTDVMGRVLTQLSIEVEALGDARRQ